MNFPYIKQIQIHDCYSIKDVNIPKNPINELKHIILTGKNGSGKTTILNRVALIINEASKGQNRETSIRRLKATIEANKTNSGRTEWESRINDLNGINLQFIDENIQAFSLENEANTPYIFSFFKAHRKVELSDVKTVTTEEQFTKSINKRENQEEFTKLFKQYLVNKKVYEAFDFMNKRIDDINQNQVFFENLTQILQNIFEDKDLKLEFKQENFEFYITLKDQRRITFNHLSEGFSAFLSVVMDLIIRTDLIRKQRNDFNFQPHGIVLIDEPETHLHLSMQYDILPLISNLFPNIQLIIATHSPAIISSLKNAIIFDLTSKEEVSDWVLGSSYSELMVSHFGLDNEYSNIADKIILEANEAVKTKNIDKLNTILINSEKYLTPSLRLEIESHIINLKS